MNEEKKQEFSFEKALEQLESIVSNMEGKKLSLDEMMKSYEEGKKLSDFCTKELGEFEKKIEVLVKETAEGPIWTEFKSQEK